MFRAEPIIIMILSLKGGVGKCLKKGTPILLGDGRIVPVENVSVGDTVVGIDTNLKSKPCQVLRIFGRSTTKTTTISLSSGKKITTTPEHPIYTHRGWVNANELLSTDWVASLRKWNIAPPTNHNMTDAQACIVAYLIGDGSTGKKSARIGFTNADPDVVEDYCSLARIVFNPLYISKSGKYTYHLAFNKRGGEKPNPLNALIKALGLRVTSKYKFIPEQIMTMSDESIAIVLRRLFSTDGYANLKRRQICYYTTSETLAKQVSLLLLRFGIISRLTTKRAVCNGKDCGLCYTISIHGGATLKFVKTIGFIGRRQKICNKMNFDKFNTNIDLIPKSLFWQMYNEDKPPTMTHQSIYSKLGHKHTKVQYGHVYGAIDINANPSREMASKVATIINSEKLKQIAESDLLWEQVKNTTTDESACEVYDLEIENCHNFVAGGIVVHNSTVACSLAYHISEVFKKRTAIWDLDITNPSVPKVLGISGKEIQVTKRAILPVSYSENLKVLSLDFFLPASDQPIIFKGVRKASVIEQFLKTVDFGNAEYLILDTPPTTSEELITILGLFNKKKINIVFVSEDSDVSNNSVIKSIRHLKELGLPIKGIVCNKSTTICPQCRHEHPILPLKGKSVKELAEEYGIPYLGNIPCGEEMRDSLIVGENFRRIADRIVKEKAVQYKPTRGKVGSLDKLVLALSIRRRLKA